MKLKSLDAEVTNDPVPLCLFVLTATWSSSLSDSTLWGTSEGSLAWGLCGGENKLLLKFLLNLAEQRNGTEIRMD